jgi:hypothetical protein
VIYLLHAILITFTYFLIARAKAQTLAYYLVCARQAYLQPSEFFYHLKSSLNYLEQILSNMEKI